MENKQVSTRVFTLPNILTTIRILLVPAIFYYIMHHEMMTAMSIFLFACVTDLADGYISRKFNMITKLGIFLDPLADKLMAGLTLLAFCLSGILPIWVFIAIAIKELGMLTGGIIALKHGVSLPANKFGKYAAFFTNAAVGSCFFYQWWSPWCQIAVYVAIGLTYISLLQYAFLNNNRILHGEQPSLNDRDKSPEDEQ